ncbi:hypothetical protein THASP1DRAFT_33557 [Thamnocephalis sphaerospora]|uniref:Small integral membrane protein 8 n=1 Tax=Thamnocephalis sphaerospora TaxID=78915 RepID=A0A4P9XGC2_9FUNG|nr:hypothetical protein THASP1DRAFT_33557 [Thamnocephalis sphaerospora]|eukprot:RKP04652.1 hypothetical protein THASP1DRAFT_33557 [Thamnocephalis sphaerospora]
MSKPAVKKPVPPAQAPAGTNQEGRVVATRLFKFMNPELFIKPNRVVMTLGLVTLAGLIGYFINDNYQYRLEKEREREHYQERLKQARLRRAERGEAFES